MVSRLPEREDGPVYTVVPAEPGRFVLVVLERVNGEVVAVRTPVVAWRVDAADGDVLPVALGASWSMPCYVVDTATPNTATDLECPGWDTVDVIHGYALEQLEAEEAYRAKRVAGYD